MLSRARAWRRVLRGELSSTLKRYRQPSRALHGLPGFIEDVGEGLERFTGLQGTVPGIFVFRVLGRRAGQPLAEPELNLESDELKGIVTFPGQIFSVGEAER